MSSLQHVYRRGHIFWWRRVHRSFHNMAIEVRLSLGTTDRFQARNRGAALTAAYEQVAEMLKGQERAKRDITEGELQAIAKATAARTRLRRSIDKGCPIHADLLLGRQFESDHHALGNPQRFRSGEIRSKRQKPKIAALCRAVSHECTRLGLRRHHEPLSWLAFGDGALLQVCALGRAAKHIWALTSRYRCALIPA